MLPRAGLKPAGPKGETRSFETSDFGSACSHQPDSHRSRRADHQTTSFVFEDADRAALFNLELRTIYSRISNPTVAVLEERIAALEGGVGTLCTASGQAALHMGIATLMGAGGHIVASSSLYGGTTNMFQYTLPRFGITATLVDPRDHKAIRDAIRPETRLVFGEVLGNPGLEVFDLEAVAAIAHDANLPLMVDATFATPHLCRPFEFGADIVMHSATKWLGGHGVAIGGALVDSGRFDWATSGKFPTLTEPYDGYHGINFAEEYGPAAFIMRARLEGMRISTCMSPTNAFHILQGRDVTDANGTPCRECGETGRLSFGTRRWLGPIPKLTEPSGHGFDAEVSAGRSGIDRVFRGQRRPQRWRDGHSTRGGLFAPRECRRCQIVDPSSSKHHPPAIDERAAGSGRHRRGSD